MASQEAIKVQPEPEEPTEDGFIELSDEELLALIKLHIPTGGITIEDVIRILIADLGVPPLTEQWEERLKESEVLSREWIRWETGE